MMTLETILKQMEQTQVTLDIYTSSNTVLYSSDVVYYEMWRYWTYSLICPPRYGEITYFVNCWTEFVKLYGNDLERAYAALYADYDPISNYDMTETGSDGEQLDDRTDTTTPSGKTTVVTETQGKLANEQKTYVAGYDSTDANGAFSDRVVSETGPAAGNTYKVQADTSYTNAKTETGHTADNTLTSLILPASGYNRLSDHHLSRRGNIGVTTSQQMIQSEIDLRKTELLASFVHRFIRRHCALMGGDHE